MDLEELEKEQLCKPPPIPVRYGGGDSSYSYENYRKQKELEDQKLDRMECPTCGKDVTLKVCGNGMSWQYTCKTDDNHKFWRWHGAEGYHNEMHD